MGQQPPPPVHQQPPDQQPSPPLARLAAATAALSVPLALLDLRMMRTGGPGIIPFELAGPERSPRILRKWGRDGRRAARASLLLDFPYLTAYTLLGVRLTRRAQGAMAARGRRSLSSFGGTVALAQVGAGACDAVENAALLGVLQRGGKERLATVARTAALAKFARLAAGWAYGVAAMLMARRGRPSG